MTDSRLEGERFATLQNLCRVNYALRSQLEKALSEAGPRAQVNHFLTTSIALANAESRDLGILVAQLEGQP